MTSENGLIDKRSLMGLARGFVERAQSQSGASEGRDDRGDPAGDWSISALGLRSDLGAKAVMDAIGGCQQNLQGLARQVTRQIDAILLVFDRFETELASLKADVGGLRNEQRLLTQNLASAKTDLSAGASELVSQASKSFLAQLDRIDRATAELSEGRELFAKAVAELHIKLAD